MKQRQKCLDLSYLFFIQFFFQGKLLKYFVHVGKLEPSSNDII